MSLFRRSAVLHSSVWPYMEGHYMGRFYASRETLHNHGRQHNAKKTRTWNPPVPQLMVGRRWQMCGVREQLHAPRQVATVTRNIQYRSLYGLHNTTTFFMSHEVTTNRGKYSRWHARGRPVYELPPAPTSDLHSDCQQMVDWIDETLRMEELRPLIESWEQAGFEVPAAVYHAAIRRIERDTRGVYDDRPGLDGWDRRAVLRWLRLREGAAEWWYQQKAAQGYHEAKTSDRPKSSVTPTHHPFGHGQHGERTLLTWMRSNSRWGTLPVEWQVWGRVYKLSPFKAPWKYDYPVDFTLEDPNYGRAGKGSF
eukprot:TRINITY_DN17025_c0_g1_i1.p1 TRINITY_DN17025_c0_g1~~TRINITY_DN17025_c0_g1_i1.p1  ORF type:complete len:309 (+),score=26.71 TRINITY_DN17025_c0_g1_i1:202-1128(+)